MGVRGIVMGVRFELHAESSKLKAESFELILLEPNLTLIRTKPLFNKGKESMFKLSKYFGKG